MSRFLPLRHWYPSTLDESASINTKSMGKVYVGYEMKWKIEASKKRLGRC